MGWFGRKASVGSLKSDLKEASQLPLDQRERLASEMAEFIEEMKLVMKSPDHESTLMREYQAYGDFRKALAVGGFSANWAQHAFRESYLLALIKASDDPKWFSEVHALLHGIRGPLGLPATERSSPSKPVRRVAHEMHYENGQLKQRIHQVGAIFDGLCESYHEDGRIKSKGNYNRDKKCGEWIESGKPVTYDPCPDCDDE